MSSKLIEKNNITFEGNQQAKRAIIFVHGFGTDQSAWKAVKSAFEADYRIILYDNVGSGNTDPRGFSPIKYSSITSYADDLLAITTAFDLKDSIVIGHSVGGMIALLAAIKGPQYFSKMAFIGASPRYLNDGEYYGGFNQAELDSMYETMRTNYYAWVSGFSAAAMGNPGNPELGSEFARTLSAIRPDIALSVAKVIFESDFRDVLNKVDKEILLIQAQKDIAVPNEVAEYLNRNISGSILTVVDAEGHFPHISAPEKIIKVINDFL